MQWGRCSFNPRKTFEIQNIEEHFSPHFKSFTPKREIKTNVFMLMIFLRSDFQWTYFKWPGGSFKRGKTIQLLIFFCKRFSFRKLRNMKIQSARVTLRVSCWFDGIFLLTRWLHFNGKLFEYFFVNLFVLQFNWRIVFVR